MGLSKLVSENTQLIAGLEKYMRNKTIVLAGKEWSAQELVTMFTNENNAIAATSNAKAMWVHAATTAKADRATNAPVRSLLRQALLAQFSGDAEALDGFGYKPRKQGTPTAEVKVIAAAKRRATRAARGTLGSKQRKAIHGELSAVPAFTVSVTPVTAPGATATNVVAPNGTTTHK